MQNRYLLILVNLLFFAVNAISAPIRINSKVENEEEYVKILSPSESTYKQGETIMFSGEAYDGGNAVDPENFHWRITITENGISKTLHQFDGVDHGSFNVTEAVDQDDFIQISLHVDGSFNGGGGMDDEKRLYPVTSGLKFSYYEGAWNSLPDFASLSPVKKGTANFPDISSRDKDDNFGYLFTGYIQVPADGEYSFFLKSDDGSKLYLNNQLLVDNDGLHSATEKSGVITLTKGRHPIKLAYFDKTYSNILELRYSGPGIVKQVVPQSAYFRSPDVAPLIITDLKDVTIYEGDYTWLSIKATGGMLKFQWYRNGQALGYLSGPSRLFVTEAGTYKVVASNSEGSVTSSEAKVTVIPNSAPVAEILSPSSLGPGREGGVLEAGSVLSFCGKATDEEDGEIPESAYHWTFGTWTYDGITPIYTLDGSSCGSFDINYSSNEGFVLTLEVVDSKGRKSTSYFDDLSVLYFNVVNKVTVNTLPQGIPSEVLLEDDYSELKSYSGPSPLSITGSFGAQGHLKVPTTYYSNGKTFEFSHWEHGGKENQSVTIERSGNIFSALYEEVNYIAKKRFEAESSFAVVLDPGKSAVGRVNRNTLSGGSSIKLFDKGDKVKINFPAAAGEYIIKIRVRSGYFTADKRNKSSYWPNGYLFEVNGVPAKFTGDTETISGENPVLGGSFWGTMLSLPITLVEGVNHVAVTAQAEWAAVDYIELVPSSSMLSSTNSNNEAVNTEAFPNPFQTHVTIKLPAFWGSQANLSLSDAQGVNYMSKVIKVEEDNVVSLDLSSYNLKDGIYFLKVVTAKGTQVIRLRKG